MSSASTSRSTPRPSELLAVFAGGCLGALARAGVAEALAVPWGTLLVNVVGAFLLGAVVTRAPKFLGTGFCGAFTTFSTMQVELLELRVLEAAMYGAASIVLGLAAVALGRRV
ncbi:CrcB family protein [Solirubrobacter sp. CPCC 204708]|uniref:Fluoride-specific ion channel FluC n=1 Tax=Solirubrobacter deserti TaxID=2282478 RepID=A0ABT4RC75_9ACTN|nr:CrcB family protein [Solirubrobacter deserti]MBE2315483.1 CrcB family protein [Solirubrobacter deserti]MDA0136123.1 CrcB family protein [Solirubrobacter deserti]